ncbi:PAS domain S-box protein [Methanolobus chelungpuianus]|uniref:histidine kinase n=1 Tax=Methanolobus chelungpuianus TaxID=502115 RepID=A0AAE3L1B2_9EURY|nr:PAS domain S-box protein [Methanolobus chelungpuianus]MCQ6963814.1 histidine kinase [Methanolobus chelungpuianus]
MQQKDLSIKAKLIAYIVIGVFLVLAASTAVSISTVTAQQRELAYLQSVEMARDYANQFDGDMKANEAIAHTLGKTMEQYNSADREEVNNILKNIMMENPALTGVYVGYEPNAFDGRDSEYVNAPGHDSTGRFVPYWNTIQGSVSVEPLVSYEELDYYQVPKRTEAALVTEPYFYQGIFMVSYDMPIMKDGEFLGVAGVDVSLQYIDDVVSEIRAFETGYAFVTGNTGILVSHPEYKEGIGSKTLYDFGIPEISEAAGNIRKGKGGSVETIDPVTGKEIIMFYEPVRTGNYSFVLVVPKEEMFAGVTTLRNKLIFISAISIGFMAVVSYLIAISITSPIDEIVFNFRQIAKDAVNGKLDTRADTDVQRDFKEIPLGLNEILEAVVAPIRETVRVTNALAQGELETRTKLELKGEFKELGDTLDNFAESLNNIIDDSNSVLTAIQNNDFSCSVQVHGEGDFKILTDGIEETRHSLSAAITEQKKAEKALRDSEKKFRTLFESPNDAIYLHDMEGNFLEVNEIACERMGYTREDFLTMRYMDIDVYYPGRQVLKVIRTLCKSKSNLLETVHMRKDGSTFPVELSSRIIKYESSNAIITIARDISNRKKNEKELEKYAEDLKHSNELKEELESVINHSPVIVFKWKPEMDWPVEFVSSNVTQLGYTVEDFTSNRIKYADIVYPEDSGRVHHQLSKYYHGKSSDVNWEYRIFTKSGDVRWVDERTFINRHTQGNITLQGIILDITERKKAEEALLQTEKIRKKEIHHRVKNNLQVISSLLYLASENFRDPAVIEAFMDSRNRVRSMALIHEELYQSKDIANIDFADYTKNLLEYLSKSYRIDDKDIDLLSNIENVYLGVDTAVPLGMIINELVSNSMKHAFKSGAHGMISVNLSTQDSTLVLQVKDNGVGLPPEIDFRNTESLGLQLVTTLVDQIDGTIELDVNEGTEFIIRFKELR